MIRTIINKFILLFFIIFALLLDSEDIFAVDSNKYWEIQSIDTMKFSRDLARERNNDGVFERIIETNVEKIASTGATHIAIGTPYDHEFSEYMKKWVLAARANGLKIWFRGNFSGWEEWFGYSAISDEEHTKKIEEFIINNNDLFEDGDIFTPCPECENGILGDPRETGELANYRQFLVREYEISKTAFEKIKKRVETGYFSMNADVARLVMDEQTSKAVGGVVVIDHYVKDTQVLAEDVAQLAEKSKSEIVLGEIGAPIPDIHGMMSDEEQKIWLADALSALSKVPKVKGINYWVSFGGTTAIWNVDGNEKPAVSILKKYFKPDTLTGAVRNELGMPVSNALVIADAKTSYTSNSGEFEVASNPTLERIVINASSYKEKIFRLDDGMDLGKVVLEKEKENIFFKVLKILYYFLKKIRIVG